MSSGPANSRSADAREVPKLTGQGSKCPWSYRVLEDRTNLLCGIATPFVSEFGL